MKGKILFLAGLGVGYVLGTRAGRERYEQIKAAAANLWNAPVVQKRVDEVQEFVKDRAPEVVEFVADGAKKVAAQVSGRSGGTKKTASRSTTSSGSGSKSSGGRSSSTKKPASGSNS
ncbi:MAG: YtxH domain-containing protein [Microbacteriaceae bacterium]|nr:MAG: YtxH domain-containing protein [Microbacteriaceae bacterium]